MAQYGAAWLSMVRRGSVMARRGSVWRGVAQLWCGMALLVECRLVVRQARVRFLAQHHRKVFPTELTADEEMEAGWPEFDSRLGTTERFSPLSLQAMRIHTYMDTWKLSLHGPVRTAQRLSGDCCGPHSCFILLRHHPFQVRSTIFSRKVLYPFLKHFTFTACLRSAGVPFHPSTTL